ncbi:MAG: T9SS type A sorting domain-containing protein [Cyanothece sp. SIO1E1]|nr:T9SS type A sorting domain-containing protein [Cyanothece sp. SIO1E1]
MKKTLLAFLCLCLAHISFAQIRLDALPSGTRVSDLVENYFLADNIIPVGMNFHGNWSNVRTFSNGEATIGLDSGIFLSTGNSEEVLQHPDSLMSSDLEEHPVNSIIQTIYQLHEGEDGQIFLIHFIPLGDSISFDFVLASEHYKGLECVADFDRLEVQLRSIDLQPFVQRLNISHVPGKPNVPVNSNTVNSGQGIPDDTICSSVDPDFMANSQYFQGNHPDLAFNGFTKVISTDPVEVIPYERYTLVISIAEGDTPDYDSGLFLGQGSFSSNIDRTARYEIINTFFEFCDTLRVGDLEITEEGAYFTRITEPYAPIDTFYQFQAYKIRKEADVTHEICPGDTLLIGDDLITGPAKIEEFNTTVEGCDSLTNHTIRWSRSSVDSIYYQHYLCSGDTLFVLDTFFTESAVYQVNTNGGICDTAYFYLARFGEMVERTETTFACPGDTIELLGNSITESTLLVDTLVSETACDTLLFHKVVFQELEFLVEDLTYCFGDTVEMRYGEQFKALDGARIDSLNFDSPLIIGDGLNANTKSMLAIKGYGATTQVKDLGGVAEICLTIEHSWLFDLDIFLTAPNGSQVILQGQEFITRRHYLGEPVRLDQSGEEVIGVGYQYCWTMEASQTMTELTDMEPERRTIPTGKYLPYGSFQTFESSLVNGTWQLSVQDLWEFDNGFLFDWSIRFSEPSTGTIIQQGWLNTESDIYQDSISLEGLLPAGDHPFGYFVETEGGCYIDTTLVIQIMNQPSAPAQIDTTICEPGFIFNQWIESSGTYAVTLGPPEFCESGTTQLLVTIRDSIQPDLLVTGGQNTYTFTIENLTDEQVLIDFGDGQSSTERTTTHVYAEAGNYQPKVTISSPCDTIMVLFQPVTVPDRYRAMGSIETGPWSDNIDGISGVQVSANAEESNYPDQLTGEDGSYRFIDFWANSSFNLRPFKNDDPLNGLDIADLIRLSRHLNGSSSFSFPEQVLAADMDCDTIITNEDLLELRSFLLEPGQVFRDSCASWIFWPQSYALEEASTPFDHPVAIAIDSIQADTSGLDFYGVKRGDIGGNASTARGFSPPDSLFLRLKNGFVAVDDTLRLDFRVENFEELVGFQVELKYDTAALAFQEVIYGEVPNLNSEHFGLSKVEEGIIRVVWLDILGNAHSLDDGALAFGLAFQAKMDIEDRMNHIAIDSGDLSAVSFDAELVEGPVVLKVDLITDLETSQVLPFKLLQNRPNPFKESTLVSFSLPKACQASLTILNLAGQQVLQINKQYTLGQHTEEIHLDVPGIYYYVFTTPWGRLSKRMVLTQ